MAVMTAPPKQTLHHTPALIALGEAIHFLPQHTKPFRRRHVLFLMLSVAFVGVLFLEVGVVITRQSLDPRALFSQAAVQIANPTSVVRSSNGFAFEFNNQEFTATAQGESIDGPASDAELKRGSALTQVTINALPSRVPAPEAAAVFAIRSETDKAAFAVYKNAAPPRTDITAILANYFAPKPTNTANIAEQSRTTESIGGTLMTKSVYQVSPKFAGKPTHTIVWTAEVAGKPLAITIQGIVVGAGVPSSMAPIMKSIVLDSSKKVEGLSITRAPSAPPVVDQKYVADLVSPAVVKVYHVICGTLVYNNNAISEDTCNGMTGSGFLVTEDGYIATNGHVVVYGAKDMLVNALLSNELLLEQFLSGTTLSSTQVEEIMSRPDLTASAVSGIYDLSDAELRLVNQREITIVATGETPLNIQDAAALKEIVDNFKPSRDLKQATIIGYDYSAKDQLTVVSDPEEGFSASDVALLKISTQNAPVIKIGSDPITQNQDITVLGFPSDADNELTDNTVLGVTVTGGSISSIRDAAGSASKLYQSDVDASHGNSGGPAIDDSGKAFGLLTYRFSSGEDSDAAKSYIRDITDFVNLAKSKNVTPSGNSTTQDAWQRGLALYSKQHYSEAIVQFKKVNQAYPSHRLVSTYIDLSQQAINQGKDIKDPPMLLLLLGIGAGLGGLGAAVVLIARHHGNHRVYRAYHRHGLTHTTSA